MDAPKHCYVCDAEEPENALGWEHDPEWTSFPPMSPKGRSFCPKHRQKSPKTFVTLGELIARRTS